MFKKTIILMVLVLAVAGLVVACGGEGTETTVTTGDGAVTTTAPGTETTAGGSTTTAAGGGEVVTLKLQGAFPEGGEHYYYLDTFQAKVEEYSNGTLKVVWGAGPEAIPATELAEAMVNDTVQLVFTPFTYMVTHFPFGNVVKALDPATMRAGGGMAYLNELTEKNLNARYLGRATDGTHFVAATNVEIKTLADFKGLKLRASPAFQALFTALGVGTVNMPLGEIYDALERNVVEGAGLLLLDITDNSLQEVMKYLIQPGVYTSDSSVMCPLGTWNKLTDVQQQALAKAMEDWEVDSKKHNTEINEDVLKTITSAGMQIIEFQGAEREQWLTLADEVVWAEAEKADPVAAEKMRTFLK